MHFCECEEHSLMLKIAPTQHTIYHVICNVVTSDL